jgi:hypothetical protein
MATKKDPLFLHVGLPKTGTTQLQGVLWANRALLASRGIYYPGQRGAAHWWAARDLLGSRSPEVQGAWAQLADLVQHSSAERVIVSHEMFAAAQEKHIEQILTDFAKREVHVVLSIRDFSRIVSATWQERAKNREVEAWPHFLESVAEGPAGGHRFWRLQDVPRILESWRAVVPGEQIHVVTVPPLTADRLLLLRRFSEAVGLDPTDLDIPRPEANQSIGAVEIAVLQRLNQASADLDAESYRRLVKNFVVPKMLATRPDQLRVVLPEETRPWVLDETRRIREAIGRVGCRVVGDLDDLDPTAIGAGSDPRVTDAPHTVSSDEVLDASARLVVELLAGNARPRGGVGSRQSSAKPTPLPPVPTRRGAIARLRRRLLRRPDHD